MQLLGLNSCYFLATSLPHSPLYAAPGTVTLLPGRAQPEPGLVQSPRAAPGRASPAAEQIMAQLCCPHKSLTILVPCSLPRACCLLWTQANVTLKVTVPTCWMPSLQPSDPWLSPGQAQPSSPAAQGGADPKSPRGAGGFSLQGLCPHGKILSQSLQLLFTGAQGLEQNQTAAPQNIPIPLS